MESSRKTRKLTGVLLLVLSFLIVGAAAWEQHSSALVQTLVAHQDAPIQIAVFTTPAMQFTYNSTTHKAVATVEKGSCSAAHKSACFDGKYDRFFTPKQTSQDLFWEGFKSALASWRFNPLIAVKVVAAYAQARYQKRTNISPAEFFLLTQQMAELDITDFAIKYPPAMQKKKKSKTPSPQELSAEELVSSPEDENRPLVVEILNASGKKGLASSLTQYLREQDNKGLLRVDVLQYDNYPTEQETSSIISYTGRLIAATQLSRAIGISSEIKTESSPTAICDARIILGKDFQMPLEKC